MAHPLHFGGVEDVRVRLRRGPLLDMAYTLYMAAEMTVSEARAELGPVTSRAEYGGETTYLTKHGHRAAAVVPAAAAELLEQLEDLVDDKAVRAAMVDLEAGVEERVPFVRRTRRGTA